MQHLVRKYLSITIVPPHPQIAPSLSHGLCHIQTDFRKKKTSKEYYMSMHELGAHIKNEELNKWLLLRSNKIKCDFFSIDVFQCLKIMGLWPFGTYIRRVTLINSLQNPYHFNSLSLKMGILYLFNTWGMFIPQEFCLSAFNKQSVIFALLLSQWVWLK